MNFADLPPLPAYRLTRKKLKESHYAEYDDKAKSPRIWISETNIRALPYEERRYIVFHELGHWFRCTQLTLEQAGGDEEAFAHLFGLYFTRPWGLKKSEYAAIRLMVSGQEKRIRMHAQQMVGDLP